MIRIKNVMSILFLGVLIFLPLNAYEFPETLFNMGRQKLELVLHGHTTVRRGWYEHSGSLVEISCPEEEYRQQGILFKVSGDESIDDEDVQELFVHADWEHDIDLSRGNRFLFMPTGDLRDLKVSQKAKSGGVRKRPRLVRTKGSGRRLFGKRRGAHGR